MRIPFFNKRKRTPSLYQKGIENEFALNKRAQYYLVRLFSGENKPENMLEFIFEQVFIIYQLAQFAGSHEVSNHARKALCMLRQDFEDLYAKSLYILQAETAIACSRALKMGEPVLQELPRSEFKLAYVQAKRITETHNGITNYLKVFHD